MLYDTFIYYNEIEMLELRLQTLNHVVDYFVIVEANRTFAGKERAFDFPLHQKLVEAYQAKIIYVQIEDMPTTPDPWEREHHQRNCIMRGLQNCGPEDVILISDADEIPNPQAIASLLANEEGQRLLEKYPIAFAQRNYYYFVNCAEQKFWHGTMAVKYRNITTPQKIREYRERVPRILQGGWHFSYLGGVRRIIDKLQSYSHQENNTPQKTTEKFIRQCIEGGAADIHNNSGAKYSFVPLDASYPATMETLIEKYPYLYHDAENLADPATAYPPQPGHLIYNYLRWYWYLMKCRLAGKEPF